MEDLRQRSKCSIFHNNFKHMIFQRPLKALLWSKGLTDGYENIHTITPKFFCFGSVSMHLFVCALQEYPVLFRIRVIDSGTKDCCLPTDVEMPLYTEAVDR